MSGIFSFGSERRDVLLLLAGLVGAVLFFLIYPGQHPLSTAEVPTESEEIELRSVEQLSRMGYSPTDYQTHVSLRAYSDVMIGLQRELGRDEAIRWLRSGEQTFLKPYYWEVLFENPFSEDNGSGNMGFEAGEPPQGLEDAFHVRFDVDGRFLELRNGINRIPDPLVNRQVLSDMFGEEAAGRQPPQALNRADSLLARLLYFDLEQPADPAADRLGQLEGNLENGVPFRINRNEAEFMARHHLEQSGWAGNEFVRDTVYIERVESYNTAVVSLASARPVHGQQMNLEIQVAPLGALLDMRATYNPGSGAGNGSGQIWSVLEDALVLLFLISCLVIFFFRIRARAVDTRSALVISVIAGLGMAAFILLSFMEQIELFGTGQEWYPSMLILIGTGIGSALSSVGIFILFATSDSITRQYWPDKLATYDYIRQGMIFNKPVGSVVLRSIVLALVMCGVWVMLLWQFSQLYITFPSEGIFAHGTAGWPPVYLLISNAWFGFPVVLGIFLIFGGLVYSRSKNRWMTGAATVLACGIVFPANLSVGPTGLEFLVGALLGMVLTLVYLKWDFSTVFLTLFVFLGFVHTASGWLAPGSPDLYIFISFLILVILTAFGAVMAIMLGKEERVLPRYVPGYVEELAQEERIKQELQIAREVQQSFLPTRIPEIGKLDLAAFCKPAHETGGDYYDFIRLDDHRVALAIGDVSGKGIQAAFYMTFIKGILHSLCRETDSPAELLKKTNRLFYDNAQKGTFISLIYGILDTRRHTFTFARAGHNPVFHYDRPNDRIRDLRPAGLGIGLTLGDFFDNNIRETEVQLNEDDLLLLYTDGIVEAVGEQHTFYGTDRLRNQFSALTTQTSRGILDSLFEDMRTFVGGERQHDDMTMVVIRFG